MIEQSSTRDCQTADDGGRALPRFDPVDHRGGFSRIELIERLQGTCVIVFISLAASDLHGLQIVPKPSGGIDEPGGRRLESLFEQCQACPCKSIRVRHSFQAEIDQGGPFRRIRPAVFQQTRGLCNKCRNLVARGFQFIHDCNRGVDRSAAIGRQQRVDLSQRQ